jgi:hypothetical protein
MTVTTTLDRQEFPGDGSNKNFPFNFKFFDNSQIFVYLIDPSGFTTGKILNVDYTLSGAMSPSGGTVVMSVAPPLNYRLLVRRILPVSQPTSIRNQGAFFPAIHEDVFDRLTMLIQQVLAIANNSIQLDPSGTYWDFLNHRAANLANPVEPQDGATKSSVEAYVGSVLATGQGPINNASNIVFITPTGQVRNVQDLSNRTDSTKGSAMVGRVYRQVDTIAELKTLSKLGGPYAEVLEYSAGAGVINTRYHLDLTDTTTTGNDFTVVQAADGGRWKLKHADAYTLKMAGGKEDGVTDDADAWDRLLAVSQGKQVVWEGQSMVGRSIVIPVNTLRLEAKTPAAMIKAISGTNFEYTLSAVGKSGLSFKGFTVDSNKTGRESALTVRTVSVSLVNCTDCQLTEVRGTEAIGFGGIPGIGISTAGGGVRVHTTNCTAVNCGVVGKAADGFFCSSSYSVNTGNVSINCRDTGHVLESCSYSGIVGAVSIGCGAAAAITNATASDKYGNYIHGITAEDWTATNTGGIQIGVFGDGNLIDCEALGVKMVGVASFIGPGISVRRTGTGRVDGLTIQGSVRNGNAQGILIDSAKRVSLNVRVTGPALSCIQFNGDCTDCVVESGSNLFGGTFGVYASGTSQVLINGIHAQSQTSYGIYAANTSVVTSLMNDIVNPGSSRYEGKDAGATLNRVTLIGGLLSLSSVITGAPLTATLSSKATLVTALGGTAGVIGLSAT